MARIWTKLIKSPRLTQFDQIWSSSANFRRLPATLGSRSANAVQHRADFDQPPPKFGHMCGTTLPCFNSEPNSANLAPNGKPAQRCSDIFRAKSSFQSRPDTFRVFQRRAGCCVDFAACGFARLTIRRSSRLFGPRNMAKGVPQSAPAVSQASHSRIIYCPAPKLSWTHGLALFGPPLDLSRPLLRMLFDLAGQTGSTWGIEHAPRELQELLRALDGHLLGGCSALPGRGMSREAAPGAQFEHTARGGSTPQAPFRPYAARFRGLEVGRGAHRRDRAGASGLRLCRRAPRFRGGPRQEGRAGIADCGHRAAAPIHRQLGRRGNAFPHPPTPSDQTPKPPPGPMDGRLAHSAAQHAPVAPVFISIGAWEANMARPVAIELSIGATGTYCAVGSSTLPFVAPGGAWGGGAPQKRETQRGEGSELGDCNPHSGFA